MRNKEKMTEKKRRRKERNVFLFIVYKISAFIFVAQYRIKKLLFLERRKKKGEK